MVFRYVGTRHPIHQLRREMDRLLSGFVGNVGDLPWPGVVRGRPAVNLWESGDALKLELELPGVQSDQIELSVVGDELSIKVERPDAEPQRATYHRRERGVGAFFA